METPKPTVTVHATAPVPAPAPVATAQTAALTPATVAPPALAVNTTADIVVDARGRRIGIMKLGPLSKMRLLKAVGPVNSKNDQYMGYAALAAAVTSIDGAPEGFPGSEAQIEAMVGRLDEAGLEAVAKGFQDNGWVKEDEAADPAKIKN